MEQNQEGNRDALQFPADCAVSISILHRDGFMKQIEPLNILVTDLNHHVRNLLQRELRDAGHIIHTACSRKEAHDALFGGRRLDLVILDPELFEIFGESLLREFRSRVPQITIIFHTFIEFLPELESDEHVMFVEKNEKSVHDLKRIVQEFALKRDFFS